MAAAAYMDDGQHSVGIVMTAACVHSLSFDRRAFLRELLALAAILPCSVRAAGTRLPATVAGISFPQSAFAIAAAELCARVAPGFLYNHCMRTYLFGALHARHHGRVYRAELAFVAAAFHDLGLLPAYESSEQPFEVDSANVAERFALEHGITETDARLVWSAAAMHDMRWGIISHQNATIELVAAGAAADVIGPDPDMISPELTREVVAAFPRMGFKKEFQGLLTGHCQRKPLSQVGTWLEGYCRSILPNTPASSTATAINAAPFSE
jgi:hypothetical protein